MTDYQILSHVWGRRITLLADESRMSYYSFLLNYAVLRKDKRKEETKNKTEKAPGKAPEYSMSIPENTPGNPKLIKKNRKSYHNLPCFTAVNNISMVMIM